MMALVAEYTVRSIALGLLVFLAVKALHVRDARLERTVWRIILVSAVSMPALLELISRAPVPAPVLSASYAELVTLTAPSSISIWSTALLALVVTVSGVLIVRQLTGVIRCWLMRQRATPMAMYEPLDVRISDDVSSPATVFSTVLVPRDFKEWDGEARRLAIEHERSHVAGKDFHVQCLAQLYRSVFWFNPFAWWLAGRLALLNEHVSDDAAVASRTDERTTYARILLSLAQRSAVNANLVPMIRTHFLSRRIERILRHTGVSQASALKTALIACLLVPILTATAAVRSPTEPGSYTNGLELFHSRLNSAALVVLPKSNPNKPLSAPKYPPASRRLGETGTVVLKLHVLEDGSVADAAIAKSSGYPDLDYSAFYEAFQWRLDPGTIDGTPSRMWGKFAVTFQLTKDP
ncbi:M56 family metallopeptidase [Peristeroidobacter soli]|uniref:M56 family metallopeptidase n=1 Tax=Peristeroidobacter soli TaxID=2497877 RepID=UPI00101DFB8E|nr:M56 family metallopeptidase [Peristeroidobacter soli]